MKVSLSALLLVFISSIAWGLTGVLIKLLPSVSPFTLTYHRLLIAIFVSLPIILFLYRKKLEKFKSLKNPFTWVLSSLMVGYYLTATAAFQLAPVAEVSLLLTISPLFVLILRYILGQKNQKHEYFGAVLAFIGVTYILIPNISLSSELLMKHLLGNTFSILSAVLTACYATLYRSLYLKGSEPDTLIVSLITLALGSAVLFGFREPSIFLSAEDIGWKNKQIYLLLGIFCTAVPTIGFAIASKKLPPVITASTSLLILIIASTFAYFILNEVIPKTMVFGSFIILIGLGIMLTRGDNT